MTVALCQGGARSNDKLSGGRHEAVQSIFISIRANFILFSSEQQRKNASACLLSAYRPEKLSCSRYFTLIPAVKCLIRRVICMWTEDVSCFEFVVAEYDQYVLTSYHRSTWEVN